MVPSNGFLSGEDIRNIARYINYLASDGPWKLKGLAPVRLAPPPPEMSSRGRAERRVRAAPDSLEADPPRCRRGLGGPRRAAGSPPPERPCRRIVRTRAPGTQFLTAPQTPSKRAAPYNGAMQTHEHSRGPSQPGLSLRARAPS